MRLQQRPTFRAGGAVRFKDFFTAARAVRAIAQAGLYPSNCRILDPAEAFNTGAADGSVAIMVLAFESADHDVEPWMTRARECCADHGGTPEASGARGASRGRGRHLAQRLHPHALRDGAADPARRDQRHVRDRDHLGALRGIPRRDQGAPPRTAIRAATGRKGEVTCRFTHVYPDGPGALLHVPCAGRAGQARRAVARDQERGASMP